jgi:hypothetical protein
LFGAGFDPSDIYEPVTASTIVISEPPPEYKLNHGKLLYVNTLINGVTPARVLIDCGANTQFMSPSFAENNSVMIDELDIPKDLTLFDGSTTTSGKITHEHQQKIQRSLHVLHVKCQIFLSLMAS